jgi:hypothetical protein
VSVTAPNSPRSLGAIQSPADALSGTLRSPLATPQVCQNPATPANRPWLARLLELALTRFGTGVLDLWSWRSWVATSRNPCRATSLIVGPVLGEAFPTSLLRPAWSARSRSVPASALPPPRPARERPDVDVCPADPDAIDGVTDAAGSSLRCAVHKVCRDRTHDHQPKAWHQPEVMLCPGTGAHDHPCHYLPPPACPAQHGEPYEDVCVCPRK